MKGSQITKNIERLRNGDYISTSTLQDLSDELCQVVDGTRGKGAYFLTTHRFAVEMYSTCREILDARLNNESY